MSIEFSKESRERAIVSIERYFRENLDVSIGNIQAGALLGYFIDEIAPSIYNQAVADVQERLHSRISEVDIECHEEEFAYWDKLSPTRRVRRGRT